MDWAAAMRSFSDDGFTIEVTLGWTLTVAALAWLIGIGTGCVIGWVFTRRQFRERIEIMQRSVLGFETKCHRLEQRLTDREVADPLSHVDGD